MAETETKHWDAHNIALWAEETFGEATALSTVIRAQSEMVELLEKVGALYASDQDENFLPTLLLRENIAKIKQLTIRMGDLANQNKLKLPHTLDQARDVMSEVADVRIVLCRVHRFFPEAPRDEIAQNQKMEINVRREWTKDGHGHGQHVKGTGE